MPAEALRELSGGELTPSALGSEADVRAELERIDAWGAARRSEEGE